MIRIYSLIGIAQIFCLYHAFTKKKEMYWYFIIIFLPMIGTLAYLYVHFFTKSTISNVTDTIESIKGKMDKNYEIEKLLNQAKYTDTISNKIRLADAYASKQQYGQAIALYNSCLKGYNADDLPTLEKLMVAYYFSDDFENTIKIGNQLNTNPLFKNSESRITYAWSLYFDGQEEKAEEVFKAMDIRYGNYVHRTEFAKFLIDLGRAKEALGILQTLEEEIDGMDRPEKRQKSQISADLKKLKRSIRT